MLMNSMLITIHEARRIAITSGASTPTYLTNQVIEYLENYPCQKTRNKEYKTYFKRR